MKTFSNIIKIIISLAIIALIVMGIVTIVKNFSALAAAFNGDSQTVINANGKNNGNEPEKIVTEIKRILF